MIIIGVASVALVVPLLMSNNISIASTSIRIHRSARVHHHAHHYYKFSYNKKEYAIYIKDVKAFNKKNAKIESRYNFRHQSRPFQQGMKDALNNVFTKKLSRNNDYANAYQIALRDNDAEAGIKESPKDLHRIYSSIIKYGMGTGSALEQIKNESHVGTLESTK